MRAFVRAVLAGVLAGASLPVLLSCGVAVAILPDVMNGKARVLSFLWLLVLPVVVTIPLVLMGSVLIGLPATLLLAKRGRESDAAYMLTGAVGGLLIPLLALLLMKAPSGYWLSLIGAFSGVVTGHTWWACGRDPNPPRRKITSTQAK
jgi:hypothetical protein